MTATEYNGFRRWMLTVMVTVALGFLGNAAVSIWWAATINERLDQTMKQVARNRKEISYHTRQPGH